MPSSPRRASVTARPAHRLWNLATARTGYVLHLDDQGRLHNLHWGPRLTDEQALSLLDDPLPPGRAFEDDTEAPLDLAPAAAFRFGHAQLQVRFPDGTRDLELRHLGAETADHADGVELVLRFADRHYPLTVESHYRLYHDSELIERHLVLRHTGAAAGGEEPITVVRADSASWVPPRQRDYRLTQAHGRWAAETRLHTAVLPYGETVLTSRRGITGHHANPWAMLDDGTAGEEHGQVWGCALAWSGTWRLTAERTPADRAVLCAGSGHDPVSRRLAPGEVLTTPVSAGSWTDGGFGAASRAWHRHLLRHALPHPDELRPVLYNSWEATGFDLSLDGQLALAGKAAALGVELFVMDDGWFGTGRSARTGDHAGLGDWHPNPDRFPDGLDPLIDGVRALGMDFGLWVEPEMVNRESELYRAHPDWVLHQPHRRRSEHRNQLVLNLARQDVADWVHRQLDGLLTRHRISFLKWDMNRPFSEAGWPEAGPEGADRLWHEYVEHLYAVLDRLRADHPGLRIESCSGGGRVDPGILSRTDQVWTSDNTDAADRLHIQDGFARLYPARAMAAWVTDSPTPLTGRRLPLDFRFHVAMAGVLGIGGDLTRWSERELARAAELVAAYKRIRPLVQHGLRYRLRPPGEELGAVQFLAPDGAGTAVLAYRRARHYAHPEPPLPLRGLEPDARYRDADSGRVHHGAVLLSRGLPLTLPADDYAGCLVHLVREEAEDSSPGR
ncbi:alpha-galactosidase [Phaeacidiphilus oryzae]|uniref:alpha-galactosidase n=1 Tax=Phaeacidiphilus oryzae TaxID=348818 RepID=UPI000567C4D9|nr:alpha-galactosidase [Phaeacidiphilus oryzae]